MNESKDITTRLEEELQELLDQNPQMAPLQFLDGTDIVTMSVTDGIPKVHLAPVPDETDYNLPHISDLQGQPVYRVYNILRTIKFISEESQQTAAADIFVESQLSPEESIRIVPPEMPPAPEVVVATVSRNHSLKTETDQFGMFRNLESLRNKRIELLAKHQNLPVLLLKTAKENLAISVVDGVLNIQPVKEPGIPYVKVMKAEQVQLYQLQRSIQGLEEKLLGSSGEVKIVRNPAAKVEDTFAKALQELTCNNISVVIRRTRKTLFIGGPEQELIYGTTRWRVEDGILHIEEGIEADATAYTKMEYAALPPNVKALLSTFFAYLSARESKKE